MATDGWASYTLADLVDIKHGFAFQGEFFRDDPPGDILLTPGNFSIGGGFKCDKFKYYVGPVPDEFILEAGDLLVTMTDLSKNADTLGYPAIVPKPTIGRYLHNQRLGKVLIRDGTPLRKDFLYYLLCTREYRHEVVSSATGTTVKHTSPSRIMAFKFLLPTQSEQEAIAHILGTLDDKIELNRRMSETLEAMARAIFKSWFVDFDPVRAKAEDRKPYGMDAATATFFPDSFQDSLIGKIPKGWRIGKASELISLRREGISPADFPSEVFDHYSVPAFDEGRLPKAEEGETVKSHKFLVPDNTVLLSKLNPRIPRVWLPALSKVRRSICSTEFFVAVPADGISRGFLYGLFSSRSFLDVFATMVTGTSGSHQRVKPESLLGMDVVIPPSNVISAFGQASKPMLSAIAHNLEQSRTLDAIREALLPKLVSGKIRVRDPEGFAWTVA